MENQAVNEILIGVLKQKITGLNIRTKISLIIAAILAIIPNMMFILYLIPGLYALFLSIMINKYKYIVKYLEKEMEDQIQLTN